FEQGIYIRRPIFLSLHAHDPFLRHLLIIQHHASRIQHQPFSMKLLLIDGHYYVYRSFFAIPNLNNSRGEPTNAIFGFTKTLRLMLKHLQPELGAVFWDEGLPQRRVELQPAYKETRKEMPGPMIPQLDFIRSTITPLLGFTNDALPDTEADDWMGCYSIAACRDDIEVVLATNDKDLYQLVGACANGYTIAKADVAVAINRHPSRPDYPGLIAAIEKCEFKSLLQEVLEEAARQAATVQGELRL